MDYDTMLDWAYRIAERGRDAGKSEQAIRDEVYNRALVAFADGDTVTASAMRKAKRIIKAVMPGQAVAAVLLVADPADPDSVAV